MRVSYLHKFKNMNNFAVIFLLATGILIEYANADSCIVCDSESDAGFDSNCVQDPSLIMPRNCRTSNPVGCYTRIVGTRTLRGCVDEMDDSVSTSCRNDSNCEICQSLSGNYGCNANIFPGHRITCIQCTGNLSSNCSVENQLPRPCRNYQEADRCYIRKTKDSVERGCLSDTSKCSNANICYLCDGHGCNDQNANSTEIPLDNSSASMAVSSVVMTSLLIMITSKLL